MFAKYRDVDFPPTREYSTFSNRIPLEFYLSTFPLSERIDLFLGYFNSSVFSVLAPVMARFIYNGGKMRIITNHYLKYDDKLNLVENLNQVDTDSFEFITENLSELIKTLSPSSKHFYDCLRYLIKEDRIEFQPVILKNGDMVHKKEMILFDGRDTISTTGSINFTLSGLIKNDESFIVDLSWDNNINVNHRIEKRIDIFHSVIKGKNSSYKLLNSSGIKSLIQNVSDDKEIEELLQDSLKFQKQNEYGEKISQLLKKSENETLNILKGLEEIHSHPRFPYEKPYSYQVEAYDNWVKNACIGLFEMATGTGKTLTAILCLIKEFKRKRKQLNIIVVPGEELINQWGQELKNSQFKNVIKWYSKNSNLNNELRSVIHLKRLNELNIVITYKSFQSEKFKRKFKKDLTDFIVVFDEAHNMGAVGFMNTNKDYQYNKRIGLSATPLRDWDEAGSNDYIYSFFNIKKPTFEFKMKDAIGKFLSEYKYYPYFSELSFEEWDEYKFWTSQLFIKSENESINTKAALKRQQVIDKNYSKRNTLLDIVDRLKTEKNIKHTLIYCPKGSEEDDESRIIYQIGELVKDRFKGQINGHFFLAETIDRKLLIEDFTNGHVDFIYAIKCLDEGVNIPVTKNAIFIASGKNKREYIQRRGRVLRKHKDKTHSNIFDIIVLPPREIFMSDKKSALNLVKNEFSRIIEFIDISKNSHEAIEIINKKLMEVGGEGYYFVKNLILEDEKRSTA
ncbi:MAG: DEAD/DEAH box helicase family protein [Flavobacteriaceae bacterium]|nr:DEAD/DEAH box helicase family protein [Flavobacteriaceae bacterium]